MGTPKDNKNTQKMKSLKQRRLEQKSLEKKIEAQTQRIQKQRRSEQKSPERKIRTRTGRMSAGKIQTQKIQVQTREIQKQERSEQKFPEKKIRTITGRMPVGKIQTQRMQVQTQEIQKQEKSEQKPPERKIQTRIGRTPTGRIQIQRMQVQTQKIQKQERSTQKSPERKIQIKTGTMQTQRMQVQTQKIQKQERSTQKSPEKKTQTQRRLDQKPSEKKMQAQTQRIQKNSRLNRDMAKNKKRSADRDAGELSSNANKNTFIALGIIILLMAGVVFLFSEKKPTKIRLNVAKSKKINHEKNDSFQEVMPLKETKNSEEKNIAIKDHKKKNFTKKNAIKEIFLPYEKIAIDKTKNKKLFKKNQKSNKKIANKTNDVSQEEIEKGILEIEKRNLKREIARRNIAKKIKHLDKTSDDEKNKNVASLRSRMRELNKKELIYIMQCQLMMASQTKGYWFGEIIKQINDGLRIQKSPLLLEILNREKQQVLTAQKFFNKISTTPENVISKLKVDVVISTFGICRIKRLTPKYVFLERDSFLLRADWKNIPISVFFVLCEQLGEHKKDPLPMAFLAKFMGKKERFAQYLNMYCQMGVQENKWGRRLYKEETGEELPQVKNDGNIEKEEKIEEIKKNITKKELKNILGKKKKILAQSKKKTINKNVSDKKVPQKKELLYITQFVSPGRWHEIITQTGVSPSVETSQKQADKLERKVTRKQAEKLIDEYVNSVEKLCMDKKKYPELASYFANSKKDRKQFWSSISTEYDNVDEILSILNSFCKEHGNKIKKHFQLALATALVWDSPDALVSSRYRSLWNYSINMFERTLTSAQIFSYFTSTKFRKYSLVKPEKLYWPLLIHLVDYDLTNDEIKWASKKYKRKKLEQLYFDVPYDDQRLVTRKPNIEGKKYTLENLQKHTGVCGDQAHFMTRIQKTFGIPAMKVNGQGKYGGHHAWAGYLNFKNSKVQIDFTGRYRDDLYFVGSVFDPQTRTEISDRFLAMRYFGVGKSYKKFMRAQTLVKIAKKIELDSPKVSVALTKYALKENPYDDRSWKLLMKYMRNENLSKKETIKWLNILISKLKNHPDIVHYCLEYFIEQIPEHDKRQKYYNQIFRIFSERPDLQIKLRIEQCADLALAEKPMAALSLALNTCIAHVKTSRLILPLVKQSVEITKAHKLQEKVKDSFDEIKKKFPKTRGNRNSRAYEQFRSYYDSL